ncbi:hypothetical protein EDB19DRAFT_1646156, partial [Suillus lakei]
YRAFGWQPDKYEYMDYEVRRNRLLRMPHVRVAVAQGGILWRLCKQELAAVIPSGPSTDVHFFADASSCKYLFDTLSEEEIDVLCGVYHVDTGGGGKQTAILSWWPTPKLWETSGFELGYWTHSAEKFFQTRLTAIRERQAKLFNARKWKGELSFYKSNTKMVVSFVETECAALIAS